MRLNSDTTDEWERINEDRFKQEIVSPLDVYHLFDYIEREMPHLLSKDNDVKLLDVACGAGVFCMFAKRFFPNWFFVGVDINHQYLSQARRRNPPENQFVLIKDSPTVLPFRDDSFDIVTAMNQYDYQAEQLPENYAREVARVIRIGGIYAVSDFTSLNSFKKGHELLLEELVNSEFIIERNQASDKFYRSILRKIR